MARSSTDAIWCLQTFSRPALGVYGTLQPLSPRRASYEGRKFGRKLNRQHPLSRRRTLVEYHAHTILMAALKRNGGLRWRLIAAGAVGMCLSFPAEHLYALPTGGRMIPSSHLMCFEVRTGDEKTNKTSGRRK